MALWPCVSKPLQPCLVPQKQTCVHQILKELGLTDMLANGKRINGEICFFFSFKRKTISKKHKNQATALHQGEGACQTHSLSPQYRCREVQSYRSLVWLNWHTREIQRLQRKNKNNNIEKNCREKTIILKIIKRKLTKRGTTISRDHLSWSYFLFLL